MDQIAWVRPFGKFFVEPNPNGLTQLGWGGYLHDQINLFGCWLSRWIGLDSYIPTGVRLSFYRQTQQLSLPILLLYGTVRLSSEKPKLSQMGFFYWFFWKTEATSNVIKSETAAEQLPTTPSEFTLKLG